MASYKTGIVAGGKPCYAKREKGAVKSTAPKSKSVGAMQKLRK